MKFFVVIHSLLFVHSQKKVLHLVHVLVACLFKIILDYLHRYTSPASQLVITALLTSVEIVINVSWLMYEPPSVTHSFPTRESRLLICEGLENYSYMVGLLYPFVLIGNIFLHALNIVCSHKCVSS
jgi:hypothetical protein